MHYLTGSIDEGILVQDIHGLGLPEATCSLHPDASGVHLLARLFDPADTIAQVAAQGDVGGGGRATGPFIRRTLRHCVALVRVLLLLVELALRGREKFSIAYVVFLIFPQTQSQDRTTAYMVRPTLGRNGVAERQDGDDRESLHN